MPDLPNTSRLFNSSCVKVASSPVPCNSMNSPASVMTMFMSTCAAASST